MSLVYRGAPMRHLTPRTSKIFTHIAPAIHNTSMSIVSKLTINNIAEEQQKTNIGDKNVISSSSKYTVNM